MLGSLGMGWSAFLVELNNYILYIIYYIIYILYIYIIVV